MIKLVLAGEFDILKGCVIKQTYPEQSNFNECILASYMIPDGVHKFEYDFSVFRYKMVQNEIHEKIIQFNKKSKKNEKKIKFQILKQDKDTKQWKNLIDNQEKQQNENINHEEKQNYNYDSIIINISTAPFNIQIKQLEKNVDNTNSSPLQKYQYHQNMDFQKIDSQMLQFTTDSGEIIGIKYQEENLEQIEEIVNLLNEMQTLSKNNEFIKENYFFNLVKNTKNPALKRGLLTRSIAICSEDIQITWFLKEILKSYLDFYSQFPVIQNSLENDKQIQIFLKIIQQECNNILNQIPDKKCLEFFQEKQGQMCYQKDILNPDQPLNIDFSYKSIKNQQEIIDIINSNNIKKQDSDNQQVNAQNNDFKFIQQDQIQFDDKNSLTVLIPSQYDISFTDNVSLIDFINVFKEKTMQIYINIILGKKVLFIGYERPIQDSVQFSATCAQLVKPFNVKTKIYPYEHLLDLQFVQHKSYIAAVSNPIFNSRDEWYDISADINTGIVTQKGRQQGEKGKKLDEIMEEKMEQVDLQFIKTIIQELKKGNLTELDVRKQFYQYTKNFIDFAINLSNEIDFETDDKVLNDAFQRRLGRFSQTYLYEQLTLHSENIKEQCKILFKPEEYQQVFKVITIIKCMKVLNDQELLEFYTILNQNIESDQQADFIFSQILEKWETKLDLLGIGLFSQDSEVVNQNIKFFKKIENMEIGKKAFKYINIMIMFQYQKCKNI